MDFKPVPKNKKMKKVKLSVSFIALLFAVACNNAENKSKDSVEVAEKANEHKADSLHHGNRMEDDQEFMVKAASGGLMEVELGKLAAQKATNAQVKEFGQKMVADHTKANAELKALAAQKNITIPTTPGEDHQEHINKLKNKTGAEFDRDYIDLMVDDHKEDVEKFEKAANNANDPDIKAFASKQVPILKQHLERARTIKDNRKG